MAFVGDRLDDFAARRPDDIVLTSGAAAWSWRHLLEEMAAAEAYICRKTSRNGRVALLLDDPAKVLIVFFACARSARTAMVMDPAWPDAHRRSVLKAARPDMCIDAAAYTQIQSQSVKDDRDRELRGRSPDERDLFYCGFTSGSTGVPKGYVRDHGSWLKSFELSDRVFGISDRTRVVLAGRLTHSLHLYGAVCGLSGGHEIALTPRFDPRSVLSDLARPSSAAALYATPTQLHFLAEAAERSGPVETVRQVLASGAKWQDRDRERLAGVFPNADLIEFYGASETSFITISDTFAPPGSVGKAPAGVKIAIGDPDNPERPGEAGPIWVKSALLFAGYLCGNDPQTRWHNGWVTFGDHGQVDENGYLFLTGRSNRMIVTSGVNVYPEEIEGVLLSHPGVAAAVVTALDDAARGQKVVAAVELTASRPDAEQELMNHCRKHLAAGKVPRRIHVVDALPLTAGGKPDIQRVSLTLKAQETPA